jgi:hypothetical protein
MKVQSGGGSKACIFTGLSREKEKQKELDGNRQLEALRLRRAGSSSGAKTGAAGPEAAAAGAADGPCPAAGGDPGDTAQVAAAATDVKPEEADAVAALLAAASGEATDDAAGGDPGQRLPAHPVAPLKQPRDVLLPLKQWRNARYP